MKRKVLGIVVVALLGFPFVMAHNAGHVDTPNGKCVNVGSGNHAPTEHQDKDPNQSGDQYGARHAADQGNTPIEARHCS